MLEEGKAHNDRFYLIISGLVRLDAASNPFRRRDYNREKLLKNTKLKDIYDECGTGNLSATFQKANLGVVTTGYWIGEENVLLHDDIP